MDLKTYFQLFWVPAIASAALMTLLWAQDELSGRTPLFLAGWFLLALGAQYLGTMTRTYLINARSSMRAQASCTMPR
jgi:4-amino-4-deoxy-L-arabinose transferase-like glycosyltransferase